MPANIFQDPSKSIPRRSDEQIVRVDFEKPDQAGKAPASRSSGSMSIAHVPNVGSKT